jgi:F420-non-reducing hydrogenase small subunit
MRVAMASLSSCLGCHLAVLDLGEGFFQLLGYNQVAFSPFLMDRKEVPECELALIEGGVRDQRQLEMALRLRSAAGKVIALGSCAVYGGVPGLGNQVSERGLFRRSYDDHRFEGLPEGLGRLLPLDSHIAVDIKVPGCPPEREILKNVLLRVTRGEILPEDELYHREATVCSDCRVQCRVTASGVPRRLIQGVPQVGECLLEQGYVCLGPVTLGGCGARCPSEWGYPCAGCRGPSLQVLVESLHDVKIDTVRRLSRAGKVSRRMVEEALPDIPHTFYKFCFAEPLMRTKRQGGTRDYHRRLGETVR